MAALEENLDSFSNQTVPTIKPAHFELALQKIKPSVTTTGFATHFLILVDVYFYVELMFILINLSAGNALMMMLLGGSNGTKHQHGSSRQNNCEYYG